jgi:hypothetical protein
MHRPIRHHKGRIVIMGQLTVALFAMTAGLTLSGITANAYRLLSGRIEALRARTAYLIVLVVAGPSMILESAVGSFRARKCSAVLLWLAALVTAYWSFALGLFILSIALAV